MDRIIWSPPTLPGLPNLARLGLVDSIIEHEIKGHANLMRRPSWLRCWILALSRYVVVIEFRLFRIRPQRAGEGIRCASLRYDIEQPLRPGLHVGNEIK